MKFTRILNLKEKIFFFLLIVIFAGSILSWGGIFYFSKTKAAPKFGGEYIEGIVGQPLHVNPIISQSNNADEDLTQLVFSSLLKYEKDGQLVPDLAERFEISEDKTTYTFYLKKNVFWHDGEALKADDIAFTINLISDPAFKSPLRSNWQGIETRILDDYAISFQIKTPYAGFLSNLSFGILPKHIWESISPEQFSLTDLNLQPIGSGPYKYNSYQKDSKGNIISYKLVSNPSFYDGKPYISKITFNFYPDDESVIAAYNTKEIMGISSITPQKISDIKLLQSTQIHKFNVPRYFAVFFNQTKSLPLSHDEVREALDLATDKDEIVKKVLNDNGNPVYSPILPGMVGHTTEIERNNFDLDRANKILDDNGWNKGEDGFRAKNGSSLEFDLVTTDWIELVQTAEVLTEQWGKIGAKVNVQSYSISDIQQNYIRPREYDALLFGQVMGSDPDPYSFWHSTQKRDPGLNLSLFGDSNTDKLIENGRTEFDVEKRAAIYGEFQNLLLKEIPAIFLYSPDYIYPVNKKLRGIEIENLISPSKRFSSFNTEYINTKRIWKN